MNLKQDYPELSLRRFAQLAGVPYWRLRDFVRREKQRKGKQAREAELRALVKKVALANPTFGYRRVAVELRQINVNTGRHHVRRLLNELGLTPERTRKPKRNRTRVTPEALIPAGRRVQIDATQVQLAVGRAWVYIVQDVPSRACLAIRAVRSLCQYLAREVLNEAITELRALGITERVVIMSDGGSDFTSHSFQEFCREVGCWVRSRVNQVGGMGILERLNRTFKYDFCFRESHDTLSELTGITQRFRQWYNHQRPHSTLAYETPWARLQGLV